MQKARAIAPGGILGVNIMTVTRNYAQYVRTAVEAGVDLIVSGAGLPVDLPAYTEGSPVKIAPVVSSLKSFLVLCRLWERKYQKVPDFVVVEGPKAGGHLGFSQEELERFQRDSYDEVLLSIIEKAREYGEKVGRKIPVLAAGGIFDKEDMCHALALGQTECRWEPALLPQRNVMRPKLIKRLIYRPKKKISVS